MANLSRFEPEIPARASRPEEDFLGTETLFMVGFKTEVPTRASDALAAPTSVEPEQRDILSSPGSLPSAQLPAGTPTPAPVARDALTVALARVTATGSDRSVSDDSIDLDAIDSRFHAGRCVCMACSNDRVGPGGDSATPLSGGATAAPAPAASLQTLADYLRVSYWQDAGTVSRHYNLGTNGNNPNAGEILYNLSGWNFDTDGNGSLDGDTNGLDTTARRDMAREAFKLFQAVLGIRFVETTATDTSVDIFFTDNDLGSAYAYAAGNSYSNGVDYSVINVSSNWYSSLSGFDTYTHQTFQHEIGHVLGLGHQGLYNGSGAYSTDAQFANDSWQASMMSYFSQTENPTTGASYAFLQTAMSVDWLALDDIYRSYGYGISNSFNGDTVYGVNTTITAAVSRIFNEFSVYADTTAYTIADASGYDTIDVSNFSADQQINLAPSQAASTTPSRSNIGGLTGNVTIGVGTVIEAATGGAGNDSFFGNDAANTFRGNGGNDSFTDSFGSDVYFGDAGSDWLYFSESIDLLRYELSGDSLLFSRNLGSADVDRVWNGLENLSFNSVAYSYQQLVDSLAGPPLAAVTISSANGLASGSATNATALPFSGTLSLGLGSNQSIAFYRNGTQVGTASLTAPGATSWTFNLQEAAGTATVSYTARVVESGTGRLGTLSSPFVLTVDTVAPVVGVNALETQDTTPLLSGTVSEAGATVSVTIGALTRTAANNGNGTWSLQWNDTLAAGNTYDVVASATDPASNSGTDTTTAELIVRPDDFAAGTTTTGAVPLGGSRSGVLELSGDRDWFAVDLQAGRNYEFRLNGAGLADPLLRLRNGAGTELASNDDASSTDLNSLIRYTAASSDRFYLEAAAFNDASSGGYSVAASDVTPPPTASILYFSLQNAVTTTSASVMGGLTAQRNDIVAFDGSRFSTWLNGDASGLSGALLRDFHIVSADEVVVALQSPVTLAGIAFNDSDLARLTRSGGGWSVSMMFDGSDVGLTTNAEAIDAVTGLADGSWLISTRGSGSVSGVSSFSAEDILRFRPTSLGTTSTGSWSLYADMSDVGITGTNENITAVDVAADGRMFLTTSGNIGATTGGTSVSGTNEDVVVFQPTTLGSTTTGSYPSPLFFDGSLYGLGPNALLGIDVPV